MKHANGQTAGGGKSKTTLVMGILAVIAVLLGIVLVVTEPSGETEPPPSSTASVATQSTTSKATPEASGNTTDSGIASEETQDIESESSVSETDAPSSAEVDFSDYEYEPGVVLATPIEGASVEDIADALGVDPSNVTQTNSGFVEIALPDGMTVEEAVETLQDSEAIASAQPDFVYELQEAEEEPEGEFEPEAQPEGSVSDQEIEVEDEEPIPAIDDTPESTTLEEASNASEAEIEDPYSPEDETGLEEASESVSTESEAEIDDTTESEAGVEPTINDSDEAFTVQADAGESTSSSTKKTADASKPNDPRVSEQWALESIDAFGAWDLFKKHQKQRVGVAIIDEGFNLEHEDLKANLAKTSSGAYAIYNVVDGNIDVSEMKNADYHGTHVAGIIAAEADNGIGVAGVSYNQAIVPIKAFYLNSKESPATTTKYLADAYAYIMEHRVECNIRVVNLSAGIFGKETPDAALENAISEARESGIVTVESAGNKTTTSTVPNYNYPSDNEQVVAVINLRRAQSTDENQQGVERYSSSNYNRTLEDGSIETCKNISAPGTDILSTYANNYGEKTGTSMAAPCVSSVLAMMFAVKPDLSVDEAVSALYATATDLGPEGFDAETGYGKVNAAAAVAAVLDVSEEEPEDPADPEPSSSSAAEKPVKAEWTAGATKMPVGSTSVWKLKNCSLKVVSGGDVVSIAKNGHTVKAKKTGTAKLAVVDSAGKQVASSTLRVYKITGKHTICNIGKGKGKLAVSKNSKKTGAKVVLTKSSKAKSIKVKVVYRNGYYQFLFAHTGKPLKIKASSKKQYAPAIQAKSLKKKATQWKVTVDSKNRLTFVNRNSGKVMAARGKSVVQRKSTGTTTEKWLVK